MEKTIRWVKIESESHKNTLKNLFNTLDNDYEKVDNITYKLKEEENYSECCSAPIMDNIWLCSDCKEHC